MKSTIENVTPGDRIECNDGKFRGVLAVERMNWCGLPAYRIVFVDGTWDAFAAGEDVEVRR